MMKSNETINLNTIPTLNLAFIGDGVFDLLVRENLTTNADSTQLLSLFDKVLQEPQEHADILELKVRYMVTKNMPISEVKPVLHQMLDIDPENDMARQQLLAYAIEENDTLGIVNVCKPAVDYNAEDPVFYYYLGVAYFQMQEKEKAAEAFRSGLNHVENSDNENKLQLCVNSMPFSVTSTISSDKTIRHFRHTIPA